MINKDLTIIATERNNSTQMPNQLNIKTIDIERLPPIRFFKHLAYIRLVRIRTTTKMTSDWSEIEPIITLKARLLLIYLILNLFTLGRKLAEKIKKEQALTVNSLRLELTTLQKLLFESSCELRCSVCFRLFESANFLQHVQSD